jgi:hypothetical protein
MFNWSGKLTITADQTGNVSFVDPMKRQLENELFASAGMRRGCS